MNFTTEKNRIYYEADGKLLAEITFIDSDENSMTINHTLSLIHILRFQLSEIMMM